MPFRCPARFLAGMCLLAASVGGALAAEPAGRVDATDAPTPWTGLHAGLHAGWATLSGAATIGGANAPGTSLVNSAGLGASAPDPSGPIGGVQLGYDFAPANGWLIGVEADLSFTPLDESRSRPGSLDPSRAVITRTSLDYLGTLRLRAGFEPSPGFLLYATGGLAYGDAGLRTNLIRTSGAGCAANNCQAGMTSDLLVGWTLGAGAELAWTDRVSVRLEYLHFDLGDLSHSMTDPNFPAVFTAEADVRGDVVRVGLNYRFGH